MANNNMRQLRIEVPTELVKETIELSQRTEVKRGKYYKVAFRFGLEYLNAHPEEVTMYDNENIGG